VRFSYKKLVARFLIPRPTLIEWQKKAKDDKKNWRVKHLDYLREQLDIEEKTLLELQKKPICVEDIFLIAVFIFFNKQVNCLDKNSLKLGLRSFGLANKEGVNYKHEFAQRIWSISINDGSKRKISNYYNAVEIIDTMTASQYALFIRTIVNFTEEIKEKIQPSHIDLLEGLTWQEVHTYDKSFSNKTISKYFLNKGVLFEGQNTLPYI
jgi:hypothetical protein